MYEGIAVLDVVLGLQHLTALLRERGESRFAYL